MNNAYLLLVHSDKCKNNMIDPLLLEELTPDFDETESESENDLDSDISNSKKGFQMPITQSSALNIYQKAGTEEDEVNNAISILPFPHVLSSAEETLILEAKEKLGFKFDLDRFQLQAVVALLNGRNVVLNAPCGSGKLAINYLAIEVLRIKYGLPDGVGICLQPLNNILRDFYIYQIIID